MTSIYRFQACTSAPNFLITFQLFRPPPNAFEQFRPKKILHPNKYSKFCKSVHASFDFNTENGEWNLSERERERERERECVCVCA